MQKTKTVGVSMNKELAELLQKYRDKYSLNGEFMPSNGILMRSVLIKALNGEEVPFGTTHGGGQ